MAGFFSPLVWPKERDGGDDGDDLARGGSRLRVAVHDMMPEIDTNETCQLLR